MTRLPANNLGQLFHPRSVAVVGITTSNPAHWTRVFLDALLEFGYEGLIYLVNPKGGEIRGLKVYESVKDIPGPIDYVISTVPAGEAPGLVRRCAVKGVGSIHFCTAGFRETGEEEGARLEAKVVTYSRESGIRIIGPNCMGIYCPRSRLSFGVDFPKESGPVAFVTQSGGNAISLVRDSMWRGVRFSKVISYGNACDLNESDFLEYLVADPDTKVIAVYVEGVSDATRFRRALQEAAKEKIVVFLKGGMTESGTRAVVGHTGALAGNEVAWDALCKQIPLIRVGNMDEMADVLVTLMFLRAPGGRNVGLIGSGGGASVLLADQFERAGLKVPPLPQSVVDEIRGFTPVAGNILRNPVDYGQTMASPAGLIRTIGILSRWEGVDVLIGFLKPTQHLSSSLRRIVGAADAFAEAGRAATKPMGLVFVPSIVPGEASEVFPGLQRLVSSGFPVYYSFTAAARAIGLVVDYGESHPGRLGPSLSDFPADDARA